MTRYQQDLTPPWVLRTFGGVCGLVALLCLAVWTPVAVSEERAYAAAPVCPPNGPVPECRWEREATVTGKETIARKTHIDHYDLTHADGSEHRVSLVGDGSVEDRLRVGATVTTTTWRGEVREVALGPSRESTEAMPEGGYRAPVGIAVLALPFAVVFFWSAHWLRRRDRRGRPVATHQFGPFVLAYLAAMVPGTGGLVAVFLRPDIRDALTLTAWLAAGTLVIVVPWAGWLAHRSFHRGPEAEPVA
ncbi:hypothetical protein F0L17_25545 [Streptomyces sp. TRM43335]|uniref:Uncharacterized protein n=1 Tax=Streptomyces taklimakanensis TaxID=2569853 RepID=A0A6G2BJE7_9ACTN|nr:hypothetical protein [Streptomyces taklimakanensis]MTE22405.1 hypothetical protein [Streptomyces taklimakanensis]